MPEATAHESGTAEPEPAGRTLALFLRGRMRRLGETPPEMARNSPDPVTGKVMAAPTAYDMADPKKPAKSFAMEHVRGVAAHFGVEDAALYVPMCIDLGGAPPKITAFAYAIPRWADDELEDEDRQLILDMMWRLRKLRRDAS